MAITENIAKWELGHQGLDPEAEHLREAFSYMPNEGLADQGEWEGFLNAIEEALQDKAEEDNGGNLPEDFTLPDWRDYSTVLAECPAEIKSGEPPLLAPPDIHVPPPPDLFGGPPPGIMVDMEVGDDNGEEEPPPPENVEEPEEKSGWTRLAALATFACLIGFVVLAWHQGWFLEYDNKDDKVVINDPNDKSEEKSEAPTPPVDPPPVVVVTIPTEPEEHPTPTDKGDNIKVICNVSQTLVSGCSNVPEDCKVNPGLWPHIRATCSGEIYCSQHGGPAAGGRGKNAELTLKKEWCKPS
ncbi:hypothetical protein KC725_01900 [Candidatus Peregrinibacteria bacterium]|nr:hypothetical protein [Candidatus Peregrinibacteria bacterium]